MGGDIPRIKKSMKQVKIGRRPFLFTMAAFLLGISIFADCAVAAVCSGDNGTPFSFIVFGDSRGVFHGVSPVLTQLVKTMTVHVDNDKPAPSFAVFSGDAAVTGGRDNLKEWDDITSPLSAKIPILFVKGNHDVYRTLQGYSGDGDFQGFQKERLESGTRINGGCIDKLLGESIYSAFSFMWNGSIFVILDTYEMPLPQNRHNGWLSEPQLSALATRLDNKTTALHKFVFTHTPAFDNGAHGNVGDPKFQGSWSANFMEMWKIVDRNSVDIVFSGHDHFYARKKIDKTVHPGWRNGVLQVISGGAGAPFNNPESCVNDICFKYDNPAEISRINHFIIVTVTVKGVSYKVYDLDDKLIELYVVTSDQ